MIKKLSLLILFIFYSLNSFSQGDDCATATPLTVNATCVFTTYTNAGATDSGVLDPGCANYQGGDVWFSVIVPASGSIIIDSNAGVVTDSGMALYSGTCGSLTLIECDDDGGIGLMSSITRTGLTPGDTLYIRFWEYGNDNNGTFDICVTEPLPAATNLDCGTATPLTVNATCVFTTFTNTGATDSGVTDPGCAFYQGGDVWFSIVVPASGSIIIDTNTGVVTDSGMALYSGACGGLTLIECDDDDSTDGFMSSITRTGLTPGDTLYIRFWEYGNDNNGTFDICVTEPLPAATNLDCGTATPLTVNATCVFTTFTNTGATDSGVTDPGCAFYQGGDVWFSIVVPAIGSIIIDSNTGIITDGGMALYSGACGALALIECNDDGSANGAMSLITQTGLTPGDTLYIRFWEYGNNNNGTFDICVYEGATPCTPGSGTGTTTLACPSVISGGLGLNGADPATIDCTISGSCVDLEATYLQLGETTSYTVESIAYLPPYQFDCLVNPVSVNVDDIWSPIINLPFDFCFFDNTYNSCIIGSNGMLSFDTTNAVGPSGYAFSNNLPSTIGDLFENTIYGVYHDMDPSVSGEVGWELITLDTGCRALVASWHDIGMFDDGNFGSNTLRYTGMIVLYENTNVIDVYIEEKSIDGTWNDGNAIVGIQNNTGTQAVVAPNRNALDPNWTVTNEAWRFVPSGTSITSLTWYEGSGTSGTVIGNTDTINVCPTSTTTYTAEITYTLCDGSTIIETDETTVTVTGSKVWNGSVDSDWYKDGNWTPNGVPTNLDCVVIPDVAVDPIIIGTPPTPPLPGEVLNLTIENNGYLELPSDRYLTVTDWINVQPNGTFDIRDSGSLIQITNVATNNNTGNINMQRSVSGLNLTDYVYWSSAVENFAVTGISSGTQNGFIWNWIPTVVGNGAGNYGEWQNTTETMQLGKGYIVRGLSGTTVADTSEFIGRPNNGIINIPITRGTYTGVDYPGAGNTQSTALDDNWNLVGNPYPSAISADNFITDNTTLISGTVYLWRHLSAPSNTENDPFYGDFVYNYNPNDYIEYNSTGSNPAGFNGNIAAGQAFFVLMDDAATSPSNITFNNLMRSTAFSNNQFYRSSNSEANQNNNPIERHRIWLDLISSNNMASSLLIGYIEGATNNIDKQFDGNALNGNGSLINFYSLIDETKFSIQGRSIPFSDEDTVPLGFYTPQNGSFSIAINSLDGLFEGNSQNIFLEDTYTNTIHNLRTIPYSFTSEIGTFNDRFILRYSDNALSVNPFETNPFTITAPNNKFIKVKSGNSPISTIAVYDLLGRVLIDKKDINTLEFTINKVSQSDGIYIVKATLLNGQQKIEKVVLKL